MTALKNLFADLRHLFYPHICNGCGSDILSEETLLCTRCFANLPFTQYANYPNNPIEKIFTGRMHIEAAHAEFYFSKESLIQHLIHQLKYQSNKEIGIYLGEIMGRSLQKSNRFNTVDALIPLPLYPDKERKRGYNQAAVICEGVSRVMNVPVYNTVLIRRRFTETQTKKHRAERWENVEGSFAVKHEEKIKGKHLLLVDDVITTGATLEASGSHLLKTAGVKLSIATVTSATK